MPEPITLLEEMSPAAPVMATVECDGLSVYLYLNGASDTGFTTRSLWLANLGPAPDALDLDRMKRGEAPRMPATSTRLREGVRLAELEPLRLVWFPEGTGAGVYGGPKGSESLLGILPPAIPENGFSGYARDASTKNPLAWPLEGDEGKAARAQLTSAEQFWAGWEAETAWPELRAKLIGAIDAGLGKDARDDGRYFQFDKGEWPPRFVAVRRSRGATVFVTGGVSIRPQPGVVRAFAPPIGPRRIELAMGMRGDIADAQVSSIARYLGGQSQLPWLRTSWLGPGHTLGTDVIANSSGGAFPAVVFMEKPKGAPEIPFPPYAGDPVTVLWLIPITEAERNIAVKQGSRALLERLGALGELWAHADRANLGVSN